MFMYRWSSEALAQYHNGHIFILADSVENARKKAITFFSTWIKSKEDSNWSYMFAPDGTVMEEYEEAVKDKVAQFLWDISVEPQTEEIIFLYGSS